MINKIKGIFKKNKNQSNSLELKEKKRTELKLDTIFYVMKYGDEIGLKVNNTDLREYGELVALGRNLTLNGIAVDINEWADWTISVKLFDEVESLKIAESIIPQSSVNWNSQDNTFIKGYSNLKWIQDGVWQEEITEKFNMLKDKIDNKKKEKLEEEKRKNDREKMMEEETLCRKRNHFEKAYKK